MKPIPPFQRLLIRSPNWLGDAVMALPAIHSLRVANPEATLIVAAPTKLAALWRVCSGVDSVIALDHPRSFRKTIPALRHAKADLALLLPNSLRSALEARLAGIRNLVALDTPVRNLLVKHRVPRRPFDFQRLHQQYDYLHLAAALGGEEKTSTEPLLRLPHEPHAGASILICPGAAYGPAKQWPAERFAEVGRVLAAHDLGPITVMGAESDYDICAAVTEAIPGAMNCAGKTSLEYFMATIASARLVITNDSGAMHLAAALGTPGVAIFGSTEPRKTGPIHPSVRVVRNHVPCSPCFKRECPLLTLDQMACMEKVTVADVLAACDKALQPAIPLSAGSPA